MKRSFGIFILCVIFVLSSCENNSKSVIEKKNNNLNNFKVNSFLLNSVENYVDSAIFEKEGRLPYLKLMEMNEEFSAFMLTSILNTKYISDGTCDGYIELKKCPLLLDILPNGMTEKDTMFINELKAKTKNQLSDEDISGTFNPAVWNITVYSDTVIVDKHPAHPWGTPEVIETKEKLKFNPPVQR